MSAQTPTDAHPRIGVLIVNYFKAERVAEGLRALRGQTCFRDMTVAIVDNSASREEAATLRAAVRDETLIIAHRNLGYTQGVNLAASNVSSCDFVLLMNPDIIVTDPRTIETMASIMTSDATIGVLGCMQRNEDGSVVEIARRFPSLPRQILRRLVPARFDERDLLGPLIDREPAEFTEFDWVQSSFVLVRADLWKAIAGLDDSYFIFMADVDLGRRAWRQGYRVGVTSRTMVTADGVRASRGSIGAVFRSFALRKHIRDAILYQGRTLGDTFLGSPRTARGASRSRQDA